jgi:hypothetical protein
MWNAATTKAIKKTFTVLQTSPRGLTCSGPLRTRFFNKQSI